LGIELVFSSLQFVQTPSAQWCGDHPHRMLMETEKSLAQKFSVKQNQSEFTF